MKNIFKIITLGFFTITVQSCSSYAMDNSNQSDMNRNVEELRKKDEAEKARINLEPNTLNNFGKPESK